MRQHAVDFTQLREKLADLEIEVGKELYDYVSDGLLLHPEKELMQFAKPLETACLGRVDGMTINEDGDLILVDCAGLRGKDDLRQGIDYMLIDELTLNERKSVVSIISFRNIHWRTFADVAHDIANSDG